MSLIDDFKARFPEFPTATVDTYVPILESVYPAYYNESYGSTNQEIILNLIAHLLIGEANTSPGARGAVTSKSAGGVSTSYATPANPGLLYSTFGSTKYGQRYLLLIKRNYGGVAV